MIDEPALEVLWLAGEGPTGPVYNGSAPDTDAAFDALAALGVLTIISVDGTPPDLERANAHGMRYVHLPIGYDGVDGESRLQIAAAVRDLPGPIYIHCHHGMHRSPASTAAALVTLGIITPEQGHDMLVFGGTSEKYPGLWRDVESCTVADPALLDAVDTGGLPDLAEVSGHVEAMVAIDQTFENLKAVAKAGWAVPPDHPDLVPAAEAGRLVDLFRALVDHEESASYPADFVEMTQTSIAHASRLEQAFIDSDTEAADEGYSELRRDCNACHNAYRNE